MPSRQMALTLGTTAKSASLWQTKDGDKIPIDQMDDEHLLNTINLIDRSQESKEAMDSLLKDPVYIEAYGDR